MRLSGYILSLLVHAAVILGAMFWTPGPSNVSIDLTRPVHVIDLVALQPPGPADLPPGPPPMPEPAPEPEPAQPKPEPKPIPKIQPPAPKPVPEAVPEQPKKPEAKPISETKVEKKVKKPVAKKPEKKPEEKKPEPKPKPKPKKPPEPSMEEVLAAAMKDVKKDVKRKENAEKRKLQRELAALRTQVKTSGTGGSGGTGGTGTSSMEVIYLSLVEAAVKQNWRYPAIGGAEDITAFVEVVMDQSGKILSSRLVQSSGKPELDTSALRAVKETEFLPEPPAPEYRTITITFNPSEQNG